MAGAGRRQLAGTMIPHANPGALDIRRPVLRADSRSATPVARLLRTFVRNIVLRVGEDSQFSRVPFLLDQSAAYRSQNADEARIRFSICGSGFTNTDVRPSHRRSV